MRLSFKDRSPNQGVLAENLRRQRKVELDVLNKLRSKLYQKGFDTTFLVATAQKLGAQQIAEDRSLQHLTYEYGLWAEKALEKSPDPEEKAQLERNEIILRSVCVVSNLVLGLKYSEEKPVEERTALKEIAQMQIYNQSDPLTDGELDLVLDLLEEETPDVVGIDFTDQHSIDAAQEAYSALAIPENREA